MRFLTAGESHGNYLTGILEGFPCGIKIDRKVLDTELRKRRKAPGRSSRMGLEVDKVQILSGIQNGISTGAPIAILIENADFRKIKKNHIPRPGHADYAGAIKYSTTDTTMISERASARETAMRVAIGAFCKMLLRELSIRVESKVLKAGKESSLGFKKSIDRAREAMDSIGGIFELVGFGVPPGLGSHVQWDRKLDGMLARSIISIPGIKGVEIGLGFGYADKCGSDVVEKIKNKRKLTFGSDFNGGITGGISDGNSIVIRAVMKPVSSIGKRVESFNLKNNQRARTTPVRADTCAVFAAAVVAEAMMAFVLTDAVMEKFGADTLSGIKKSLSDFKKTY